MKFNSNKRAAEARWFIKTKVRSNNLFNLRSTFSGNGIYISFIILIAFSLSNICPSDIVNILKLFFSENLDKFYNLYELLENKTELTIDIKNKTSINISLIKSNNIFASCFYNIKQGEQWLTFSYENKKKKEISF